MEDWRYIGDELELFSRAENWKRYLAREIAPHIKGSVLEVGAGIGTTTEYLSKTSHSSWLCLEPDEKQSASIREKINAGKLPATVSVTTGFTASLPKQQSWDTILYIDVLEHIENDSGELACAAELLRPGGKVIVLSPAHQWLFCEFDRALGHFRRYDAKTLMKLTPSGTKCVAVRYLDSAGLLASSGNRFVQKSSRPTPAQIKLWDSVLVRISTISDYLLFHKVGKSILAVWQKA